ncbi:MAG: glycosyltransferase family 2 protein [Burkholderiales bacterium]|nr:MAG: glycosyltransferase family 2 protein [Burkholderiales bacterium]
MSGGAHRAPAGAGTTPDVSVIVVSYNTREILRRCLARLAEELATVDGEVIVVDNASADGSADMVADEFPAVQLVRSTVNLGFAAGNNRGFALARGRYVVLLNPDAFLGSGALARALAHMERSPHVGIAGGRLQDPAGRLQPSGRLFPSLLNELMVISGLAARYPRSRLFGRFDRTWADPDQAAQVDWVPGAFTIIRGRALGETGGFDERFFLYYEEVDLCRRMVQAGYEVWYWPDVVVTHIGGASSKTVKAHEFSCAGSQLTLWRLRSALLYYRKHHGRTAAWGLAALESLWHRLRIAANAFNPLKHESSRRRIGLVRQAWTDTAGGVLCPPRPW